MNDTPDPAARLRETIKKLAGFTDGGTQESRARKLGISDTALSNYLAGTQIPREDTLAKMLDSVGVPMHERGKYLKIRQEADNAARRRPNGLNGQAPQTDAPPPVEAQIPLKHSSKRQKEQFRPRHWFLGGLAGSTVILAGTAVWAVSTSNPESPAEPAHAISLQCSLVNSASSPVYVKIGDPEPVKSKIKGDRVRLVPIARKTGPDGKTYQAVALPDPHDSPNGIGWMPVADLIPDPRHCASLGNRP
ncbi:helix-turn-helix domain-containing protein [Nonomuraea guangzhouensis]|uniref:Helix-turn-helix domain-containing protein n=1 Tax=Nonomuraea guangzhouensis TaxID=1291555 RepID=A0ABW4GSU2_9ACTN|nr:helix-turn-helix domain-containing protein [Nonomuraea guangzhouensis]